MAMSGSFPRIPAVTVAAAIMPAKLTKRSALFMIAVSRSLTPLRYCSRAVKVCSSDGDGFWTATGCSSRQTELTPTVTQVTGLKCEMLDPEEPQRDTCVRIVAVL